MANNLGIYKKNESIVCNNGLDYEQSFFYLKRKKPKLRTKKNLYQILLSYSLLLFFAIFIMPKSLFLLSRSILNIAPYKNIKYDYNKIAYPTVSYFSNSWFLGERFFKFENSKKPEMIELKENVNMPVLESGVLNMMKNYPEIDPSIYVWEYETQNYIAIKASQIYPTASIIKIPILIDVFKSIEAKQFNLDNVMELNEVYRTEGSGKLQFKARNSKYTIDELANRMITDSDNSATNMLLAKVGSKEDVNSAIRNWGLKNTEIINWLPDLEGKNHSTARELARMIYNIDMNSEFLSETSRSSILNYMGHVHNNRLIQAGLDKNAIFLHKTGDIGSMLGDAGIVIAPNGKKYIIVILANRPKNSYLAKEFIVNTSKLIYDYMVK